MPRKSKSKSKIPLTNTERNVLEGVIKAKNQEINKSNHRMSELKKEIKSLNRRLTSLNESVADSGDLRDQLEHQKTLTRTAVDHSRQLNQELSRLNRIINDCYNCSKRKNALSK